MVVRTPDDPATAYPDSRRAEARHVVGLAVRTTNAAESAPSGGQIAPLWDRFMAEGWGSRLEKLGAFGPAIAVYSAYESDANGSYQLLVGRQVRKPRPVAGPLVIVTVPQASYLVFNVPGPLPQAVMDGWREVWAYFARPHAPPRAYTFDVEMYPEGEPVEIWVAVR